MMLFSAATLLAFQDIVENQVNASRITSIMNRMQAPVIDFVDLSVGKAQRLLAHFEKHTIIGDYRHMHAMCMRQ